MTKPHHLREDSIIQLIGSQSAFRVLFVGENTIMLRSCADGMEFLEVHPALKNYRVVGDYIKAVSQIKTFLRDANNTYDAYVALTTNDGRKLNLPIRDMYCRMQEMRVFFEVDENDENYDF